MAETAVTFFAAGSVCCCVGSVSVGCDNGAAVVFWVGGCVFGTAVGAWLVIEAAAPVFPWRVRSDKVTDAVVFWVGECVFGAVVCACLVVEAAVPVFA